MGRRHFIRGVLIYTSTTLIYTLYMSVVDEDLAAMVDALRASELVLDVTSVLRLEGDA